MTNGPLVNVVVEGPSDATVVERLVLDHGFSVQRTLGMKGKGHVTKRLEAYNAAAKFGLWLVVRDLDLDAPCAPQLVRNLLPKSNPGMAFRIAVRAIEAWLLADAVGAAKFFRVRPQHVPLAPEKLRDPKTALIEMAKHSTSRAIREDMMPATGTTARVGPGYVGRVIEFAREDWNWKRAVERSDSLKRCVARVAAWQST